MYLAGLIADDAQNDQERTSIAGSRTADGGALRFATVPWVAAGSQHGYELALAWIESDGRKHRRRRVGTLSSLVAIKNDDDLDLAGLERLLRARAKDNPSGTRIPFARR